MTAQDILKRLQQRYGPPQWLAFPEMKVSTGYSRGLQRIDFFAMHSHPSKGFERRAFEIKVSRADFNTELRKPQKRRPALMLVNRFYFIAPVGIVPVEKLPIDAGLVEIRDSGIMQIAVEAPWIDTEPPTWGFVAALIRRVQSDKRTSDVQ